MRLRAMPVSFDAAAKSIKFGDLGFSNIFAISVLLIEHELCVRKGSDLDY